MAAGGLFAASLAFVVPTPPAYLAGKEVLAAREALDFCLFRLLPRFPGVLLAYADLACSGPGSCIDDQLDVVFPYQVNAILFNPAPGTVIACQVNEQYAQHIALTAMGAFRVVVRSENISNGMRFNTKRKAWTANGQDLTRNAMLEVRVVKLVGQGLEWQIEGELVES